MRGPLAEDDGCEGDEALTGHSGLGELRDDGQRDGCAAKARHDTREHDARKADTAHVDAERVGGRGVLAHGAHAQAPLGLVQHEPHHDGGNKAKHHGDVDVEVRPRGAGKSAGSKHLGQRLDGRALRTAVPHQAGEEQGDARSQQVERDARDVLVGLERDGRHGVQQRKGATGQAGDQKAEPCVAGEERRCGTGQGADGHHALDTDIDDAGALGDHAAQRAEHQRRGVHKGDADEQGDVIKHCRPPSPRQRLRRRLRQRLPPHRPSPSSRPCPSARHTSPGGWPQT